MKKMVLAAANQSNVDADLSLLPDSHTRHHTSNAIETLLFSRTPLYVNNALRFGEYQVSDLFVRLYKKDVISSLQSEAVLLALIRHRVNYKSSNLGKIKVSVDEYYKVLNSKKVKPRITLNEMSMKFNEETRFKMGFFLGDGPGMGKGRTIAMIMIENMYMNCPDATKKKISKGEMVHLIEGGKHVWITKSRSLFYDASRDFRDLLAGEVTGDLLFDMNAINSDLAHGVLCLTYDDLCSESFYKVIDWLGVNFSGVMAFDECHLMSNLKSNTSKAARGFIDMYPLASIIYSSATGMADYTSIEYLPRLGIYGFENSSFNTYEEFAKQITNNKITHEQVNTLLGIQLKSTGMMVSRKLSLGGCSFVIDDVKIEDGNPTQKSNVDKETKVQGVLNLYDTIVRFLHDIYLATDPTLGWAKKTYWAMHLAVMNELLVCYRVLQLREVKKKIDAMYNNQPMSYVIGTQSVGSAMPDGIRNERFSMMKQRMEKYINAREERGKKTKSEGDDEEEEERGGDEQQEGEEEQQQQSGKRQTEGKLKYIQSEELRAELIKKLESITCLPNSLDLAITILGGPNKVGEITGRTKCEIQEVVKGPDGKNVATYHAVQRQIKTEEGIIKDPGKIGTHVNRLFSNDEIDNVIISQAGSTGISLHAVNVADKVLRRRCHVTIEYPYSADEWIQQLGRSHRSNSSSSPVYYTINLSFIPADVRFISILNDRVNSMSTVTSGGDGANAGSRTNNAAETDENIMNDVFDQMERMTKTDKNGYWEKVNEFINNRVLYVNHADALNDDIQWCRVDISLKPFDLLKDAMQLIFDGTVLDLKRFYNRLLGLPLFFQWIIHDLYQFLCVDSVKSKSPSSLELIEYLYTDNVKSEIVKDLPAFEVKTGDFVLSCLSGEIPQITRDIVLRYTNKPLTTNAELHHFMIENFTVIWDKQSDGRTLSNIRLQYIVCGIIIQIGAMTGVTYKRLGRREDLEVSYAFDPDISSVSDNEQRPGIIPFDQKWYELMQRSPSVLFKGKTIKFFHTRYPIQIIRCWEKLKKIDGSMNIIHMTYDEATGQGAKTKSTTIIGVIETDTQEPASKKPKNRSQRVTPLDDFPFATPSSSSSSSRPAIGAITGAITGAATGATITATVPVINTLNVKRKPALPAVNLPNVVKTLQKTVALPSAASKKEETEVIDLISLGSSDSYQRSKKKKNRNKKKGNVLDDFSDIDDEEDDEDDEDDSVKKNVATGVKKKYDTMSFYD